MTDETIDKNLEVLEQEAKKCFESAEILHNKVKAIDTAWEEWYDRDPLVDRLIRNNLPSDLVAKMEKERRSMYGG